MSVCRTTLARDHRKCKLPGTQEASCHFGEWSNAWPLVLFGTFRLVPPQALLLDTLPNVPWSKYRFVLTRPLENRKPI